MRRLAAILACCWALICVTRSTGQAIQSQSPPPPATAPSAAAPSAGAPALPGLDCKSLRVLFDGNSLDGWEYDPDVWSIQNRAMHGTGKYGQIFTNDDYGDFRLIITARVVLPETNTGSGHLGVLFWGDRPADGEWKTAGALQVQPPNGAMWDYRTNKNVKPERVVPKPQSLYHDWHTAEILAHLESGEIRMAVDGVEIIRYKHPNPAVLKRGPIGMQLHAANSIVEYRDIRIEPDPKDEQLITIKK